MSYHFPFFQKAALALLGSRSFRHGLINFFNVLREHFPIEAMTFDRFFEDEHSVLVDYVITRDGFFDLNARLPLTEFERNHVREQEKNLVFTYRGFSDCGHAPSVNHSRLIERYVPFKDRGYMIGILKVDGQIIGHLAYVGRDVDCFTEEHARLLEMILPTCAQAMANMLAMQNVSQQNERMLEATKRMQDELNLLTQSELVGAQGGLRHVVDAVLQLSGKDTPVLILGETGTGKEVLANAIQKQSTRVGKPFIKVNCGALTDTLLDSELFGHERGAFTGATSTRQGRFEQADSGTLFLDEVGELSPQAQVRLLRVLQDGTFERIGGRRPITVDVRIIAATNRNLQLMCQQGQFREDLFHRLNVFPITMPPLRRRLEDLPLLINYLAERTAKRFGVPMPTLIIEHLDKLMRYSWPGNIRELENLVERAFILNTGEPLDIAAFLPTEDDQRAASPAACPQCTITTDGDGSPNRESLDRYIEERVLALLGRLAVPSARNLTGVAENCTLEERIRRALAVCNGKVYGPGGAAELLGVNHNTLRSRMRKLGIKPLHAREVDAVAPQGGTPQSVCRVEEQWDARPALGGVLGKGFFAEEAAEGAEDAGAY